jgi:hypothetical protein
VASALKDFLIAVTATVIGTLAAQWALNNVRAVRRTVGGI